MKELWGYWGDPIRDVRRVLKTRTIDDYVAAVDRVLGRIPGGSDGESLPTGRLRDILR